MSIFQLLNLIPMAEQIMNKIEKQPNDVGCQK